MMNRNDRIALKRNRSAVSWLTLLAIILIIWLINVYRDKSYINDNMNMLNYSNLEYQNSIASKNHQIDSLSKVIYNLKNPPKDTTTKVVTHKFTKIEKKDSIPSIQIDTVHKLVKDSLK